MAARTRVKGHRTGQRAALGALELLLDAGCATNELTGSDYGFDIHALLPERYPAHDQSRWAMTSRSALVQVKGGARFNRGVELTREMWRFYLRAPTPVYLAVIPARGEPWIELVDRLAYQLEVWETAQDSRTKERLRPEPGAEAWNPRLFVEDAILQSALGTRSRRRILLDWASAHNRSGDPDYDFVWTLAELALAEGGDYTDIDRRVAAYHEELPGLVDVLAEAERLAVSHDGMADLSHWDLAGQLSGDEYLEAGGSLSSDALRLREMLHETAGNVHANQLVLLAHREHFTAEEHLSDRGLA